MDERRLEVDDLLVAASPLLGAWRSPRAARRAPVRTSCGRTRHIPPRPGSVAVEAPQVVVALLVEGRLGERVDAEVPWVERLDEVADGAALARRVGALHDDQQPRPDARRSPICPPRCRRSWRKRCCASIRRCSYSLRLIRSVEVELVEAAHGAEPTWPATVPTRDSSSAIGGGPRRLRALPGRRSAERRTASTQPTIDADAEDEPLDRVAEVRAVVEHRRGDVRRVLALGGSDCSSCRYIGSTSPPNCGGELGDVDAVDLGRASTPVGSDGSPRPALSVRRSWPISVTVAGRRRRARATRVGDEAAVDDQHRTVVLSAAASTALRPAWPSWERLISTTCSSGR